jgi:hypothetical protein
MPVSKASADHVVGRICGVQEGESRIAAAEKAIAIMRSAGLPTRKAEAMLAAAKARGVD